MSAKYRISAVRSCPRKEKKTTTHASSITAQAKTTIMPENVLPDEQLHALLDEAEARLKSARQITLGLCTSNFPSLSLQGQSSALAPCVKTTDQGAQVSRESLVGPEERRLANGIRCLNDPVSLGSGKKASKVCAISSLLQPDRMPVSLYEDTYPNFYDGGVRPVLGPPRRSVIAIPYFIVTLRGGRCPLVFCPFRPHELSDKLTIS